MKMKTAAIALLAVFGTVLFTGGARAAEEETEGLHVGAGVKAENDSNVLRQAPTDPAGVASVFITNPYGLASYDRTYSKEHVFGSINIGQVFYSGGLPYSYNYTSQAIDAGYRYGSWDHFNVGVEWVRSAAEVNFADTLFKVPDIITSDTLTGDLDEPVTGNWHLVASATGARWHYSDKAASVSNLDTLGEGIGVRYVPSYGNRIDLIFRYARGTYPNGGTTIFINAAYRDRAADASVSWHFSGKSTLNGHAGFMQRRDDRLSFRDFSGLSYDLAWVYLPAADITTTLSGSRVMGAAGDAEYLTAATRTLRLAAAWQATGKIKLEGGLYRSWRNYFGDELLFTSGVPLPAAAHVDAIFGSSINASWVPTRWLTLSADLRAEHRNSNQAEWSYSDRIVGVSAQVRTDYVPHFGWP